MNLFLKKNSMRWIYLPAALCVTLLTSNGVQALTATASPTTCASVAGIGTANWGNPARAISSDNSYADASVDGTTSRYLQCTGYGFAIPAGSTINGIRVNLERKSSTLADGGSQDAAMRLVKAGAIGTTDRSTTTIYTTADVVETHGSATDLWGTSWTVAEVNNINFGTAFAAIKASSAGGPHNITVDQMQIVLDYSPPPLNHFSIFYDGAASVCGDEPITISAHVADHSLLVSYTGTISLSTSNATGTWALQSGSGAFTNIGSGSASYTFAAADNGVVMLKLTHPTSGSISVNASDGPITESTTEDPSIAFTNTGTCATATAGPTSCATVTGIGTVAWANPTRATVSDNSYATASVDGTTSNYLRCIGYNFGLPAGVTLNGIVVDVERSSNSVADGGSKDAATRLLKAGVITGNDRALPYSYTTADVVSAHGATGDLWGSSWSVADVNNPNFGAAFAATKANAAGAAHSVSIDHMPISIGLTYPPGTYSITSRPGTCASVAGIGTVNWTNPTRATASDNSYATASVDGTTSVYLRCTGYNFSAIPSTATLNGFTVNVERRSSSTANGGSRDAAMRLVKTGVIGTTNRSTSTLYTTADVVEAHGSASDLWGTTWTVTDVKNANFGAAFAATKASSAGAAHTISADQMTITTTFTVSNAQPSHFSISNDGAGSTCYAEPFTIRAHQSDHSIYPSYTGTISLSTSDARGDWTVATGSGTLNNGTADDGAATYTYAAGDGSSVILNLAHRNTATGLSIQVADGSVLESATEDPPINFTTAACIDHIRLEQDGNALTCAPESITIKACANADCTSLYSGGTTSVTLSGSGWTTNPAIFTGSTTNSFAITSPQTVTLGVSAATPTPVNSAQCLNTANPSNPCQIIFADTGFIFSTLPNQTAGVTSGSISIEAVKKATNSAVCTGAFSGNVTIDLAQQCLNPNSCLTNATVNSTSISASYTPVTLNFGANSTANFTLNYADVGQLSLLARYSLGGGDYMTGASNAFITKPSSILISNIQRSSDNFANPAAANENGLMFIKAGDSFSATITAATNGGAATPNFGKEATPEGTSLTRALVAPTGGAIGTLVGGSISGASFLNGVATATNLSWDEVGIISLTPSILDGDYLGAGSVTGSNSGNIGRFTPAKFAVSANMPDFLNGPDSSWTCSFTYMDQDFAFDASPTFTITALNANGDTTTNYDSAFWKLGSDPLAARTYTDTSNTGLQRTQTGTLTPSDVADNNGFRIYAIGSDELLTYQRGTPAALFVPAATLRIPAADGSGNDLTDSDGICYDPDNNATCDSFDITNISGNEQRFGRANISNAFGSELVDLAMSMTAQYYTANGFVTNVDDLCTSGATTALSNFSENLAAGETTPSFSQPPVAGDFNLYLTLPGAGNNGGVDVTATVPSYLRFDWAADGNQDGNYDDNPQARATFGIFKGTREQIYMREIVR